MKQKTRFFCMTSSLALLLTGLTTGPVFAEDAAIEEVVVTGSRIKEANLVNNSPVTTIGAEEVTLQGTVRIEDMLRNLPQVYLDQGAGASNGATGTATIDLRNLGEERTLVMINGRRLPAGSPLQGGIAADINQVPAALVERVDVLTGGASATYGADAVAGVVNFIMKSDFQGVQLDAQFSQYQHDNDNGRIQDLVSGAGYPVADSSKSDGDLGMISLIIGGNLEDGRGNITTYITYRNIEEVTQDRRDYSSCALSSNATACVGSGTIPDGRIVDATGDLGDFDYKTSGTDFVPTAGTTFNYGPLNYFQRPDEQWSAGVFARYALTDQVEAYSEFMFTDNQTVSQIAPSGAFFVSGTLSYDNPFLSAQQRDAVWGTGGASGDTASVLFAKRNVEGGNRQQDLRHTSYRGVLGIRGDINSAWSYDLYGLYSEVSMENTYLNDLSITKIGRALNVVDDGSGNAVCAAALSGVDPSCVPWNIFQTGAITQEMTDYLVLPLFARGTTDQTVVSGYVAGDLGEYGVTLPWADSGINAVAGFEYREENLDFNPDSGFLSGDGAGQGGATTAVHGGYDVSEIFFEFGVPVIQGAPLAEELAVNLAYRYSDFSTGVTSDTYGIRVGWALNNQVKFRGSYQRAVRAPNVRELFQPQGLNLFDMSNDPCGPNEDGVVVRSAAECTNGNPGLSGSLASRYGTTLLNNPAQQFNYLQGGNEELQPEKSDTYSFGVVWQPEFANMTVSLDYFDIEIKGGIDNLTPEFILNECLDGNQSQCQLVQRNSSRGDLWIGSDAAAGRVVALNDNLAIERVKGFDVVANYVLEIGDMGSLDFYDVMSIIDTWDQQELAGAPVEDCKGMWGGSCGDPKPDFQNNLRVSWITPWDVSLSGFWRHISKVDDVASTNVTLGSRNYFDLSALWDINESFQMRLGVNNVFDEAPPIAGGSAGPSINGNGNVFPGSYDALGRYWFLGARFTL